MSVTAGNVRVTAPKAPVVGDIVIEPEVAFLKSIEPTEVPATPRLSFDVPSVVKPATTLVSTVPAPSTTEFAVRFPPVFVTVPLVKAVVSTLPEESNTKLPTAVPVKEEVDVYEDNLSCPPVVNLSLSVVPSALLLDNLKAPESDESDPNAQVVVPFCDWKKASLEVDVVFAVNLEVFPFASNNACNVPVVPVDRIPSKAYILAEAAGDREKKLKSSIPICK